MTPFLALGGYFLADTYKENENEDKDKKLVVTDRCLPVEDRCEVLGIGMEMHLKFQAPPSYQRLLPIELLSKTSLDDVAMSLIIAGEESQPVKMIDSGDKKRWTVELMPTGTVTPDNMKIRLAVSYKAALHLAEFPIKY